MKRWFKIVRDEGTYDYMVINANTGEKEALIMRYHTGKGGPEKYIRFIRNPDGNCWEKALYHPFFANLKEVSHYYDCVNH